MTTQKNSHQSATIDMPPHPLEEDAAGESSEVILPLFIQRLLQAVIVLTLPVVLVVGSARLVMTEEFLQLEYNRPGFPEDRFGFSTEEREEYGAYGVRYLVNNEDISYLADLEIEGGRANFEQGELQHMEDVQAVTTVAFQVLMLCGALLAAGTILMARKPQTRDRLRRAYQWGGGLTIALAVVLTLVMFASWDFFFDTFHDIFFDPGTWRFNTSDTLIRLYPEQFWFDASLAVGILALAGSLACILVPWWWEKRLLNKQTQAENEGEN
jgi:integral membrane protein (TIGR01906 family)